MNPLGERRGYRTGVRPGAYPGGTGFPLEGAAVIPRIFRRKCPRPWRWRMGRCYRSSSKRWHFKSRAGADVLRRKELIILILKTKLLGRVYDFKSVKDVLAKANEVKSGDSLAGIAAETAEERVAAKVVVANCATAPPSPTRRTR